MPMWLPRMLTDFLFPPECCLCERPLMADDEKADFIPSCAACRSEFPEPIARPCQRCGAGVGPYVDSSTGCSLCAKDSFAFRSATAYGVFEDKLGELCHRCKNRTQHALTIFLTEKLLDVRAEWFARHQWDYVLPVPMHWRTRIHRPVHPNQLVADHLAKRLEVRSNSRFLRQIRPISRQSSLRPTERRKNVRGAYEARLPFRARGASFLLVDDILTTGSTAHECAKVLKAAGSGEVDVVAIARGVGR